MFRKDLAKPLASRLALALAALYAGQVSALTFTVGGDEACDFDSVATAINVLPSTDGPHLVRVMQGIYPEQAIEFGGKELTLHGGYANCVSTDDGGPTVLSGAGGNAGSVMRIGGRNNDIVLDRLSIVDGDDEGGEGGGIEFVGSGDLTLRNTKIERNRADYGGGISMSPSDGRAILWIEGGTVIESNRADTSGGGIRLFGNAQLVMVHDPVSIAHNAAESGYGGGLEIIAPAQAVIGASGAEDGLIAHNNAQYGGGISINGYRSYQTAVHLFAANPAAPPRIVHNRAVHGGGGVYLESNFGGPSASIPRLCARSVAIDQNKAANGAAIYADKGGRVYLGPVPEQDSSVCALPDNLADLPVTTPCTAGEFCTTIDANATVAANGTAIEESIVLVQNGGDFSAIRFVMRGNGGGEGLRFFEETQPRLEDCLIAGNTFTRAVARVHDDENLALDFCTIAGNWLTAPAVLAVSGDLTLKRSIVWQEGHATLEGDLASAEYVLSNDPASLDNAPTVVSDDPRFVDPASNDYRLQAASRAVDFAPDAGAPAWDLDGNARIVDLGLVPDALGPADLGAYERQSVLPLVRNADFDRDISAWTSIVPGIAAWNAASAVGGNGSGSVLVATSAALAPGHDLVGPSQCIRLPAPGTYRITGHAMTPGAPTHRDSPRLHWRYRRAGLPCDGPRDFAGELNIPARNAWATPNAPGYADVAITPAQWTSDATLEVFLVVKASANSAAMSATSAYFDGVTVTPVP